MAESFRRTGVGKRVTPVTPKQAERAVADILRAIEEHHSLILCIPALKENPYDRMAKQLYLMELKKNKALQLTLDGLDFWPTALRGIQGTPGYLLIHSVSRANLRQKAWRERGLLEVVGKEFGGVQRALDGSIALTVNASPKQARAAAKGVKGLEIKRITRGQHVVLTRDAAAAARFFRQLKALSSSSSS